MGTSPDFYHCERIARQARRHRLEAYLLGALLGGSPLVFLALALLTNS